jgi:hypothetical protein
VSIDYLLDPKAKCIEIGALLVRECIKNTVAVLLVVLLK